MCLCTELFPSPLRVLGAGFVFSFGRFAGFIASYMALPIFEIYPFVIFSITALLILGASLNTVMNLKDTRCSELDAYENKNNYD